MPYLFDSDIVIDHLARVLKNPHPDQANQQFEAFTASVPILPFSTSTAKQCTQLREDLKKAGKRVHQRALDLTTAAIAIEHSLMLVTRNVEDYKDIPDLNLY